MRLPAPIRKLARRMRGRFFPGGLILLYHRVTGQPTDLHWLAVTPERFAAQMEVLRQRTTPLPLVEFAERARAGTLPRRAVAVTVDDGYADNLWEAKPALERSGIPATVFVAGDGTPPVHEFFWDELARLLLQPGHLPAKLAVRLRGAPLPVAFDVQPDYSKADQQQARDWNPARPANSRQKLYGELCNLLRPLPAPQQQELLEQLRQWAGAEATIRNSHRAMTPEELRKLADGGLVELGGHTLTHPSLAMLSPEQQTAEITGNKRALEATLGRPVRAFAYPFGNRADYTPQTVEIVEKAGFTLACSNFRGIVRKGTDPYQLPRIPVENWEADVFAARLEERFND